MPKESKFNFNSINLLEFAWEKRKILIAISLAFAIVSAILSYRIPEQYKSTVVVFPTSAASVSKTLIAPSYTHRQSLMELGDEEQGDQLLQILNSDFIKNKIVEKYDLFKHYEIDPESKHKNYMLNKEYREKITCKRTKYTSIVIEVMDEDPQMAANIANDIAAFSDSSYSEAQKDRAKKALSVVENEVRSIEEQLRKMDDSIKVFYSLGVVNVEYQIKELTKGYATALLQNDDRAAKEIGDRIKIIEKYGTDYTALKDNSYQTRIQYTNLKLRLIEAKVETDADKLIPRKYVVDYATPADRKSYPKKSVIVIQSTFIAFVLTYLALLVFALFKKKS